MDICQTEVRTGMAKGQFLMIQAQQMQHRQAQVLQVHFFYWRGTGLICFHMLHTRLCTGIRQPQRETKIVVAASMVLVQQLVDQGLHTIFICWNGPPRLDHLQRWRQCIEVQVNAQRQGEGGLIRSGCQISLPHLRGEKTIRT